MEAIEQNPVIYELMTEMAWRNQSPDIDQWLRDYSNRRYGADSTRAHQAWLLMKDAAYKYGSLYR